MVKWKEIGPMKKPYMCVKVDTETSILEEVVVEFDEDEVVDAEDFRSIRKD